MAKENDTRVVVCEHTKKKIVQVFDGKEWMCLHTGSDLLDKTEVEAFETKGENLLK